ncbi:EcsC family protein [Myxococcota bacterium]
MSDTKAQPTTTTEVSMRATPTELFPFRTASEWEAHVRWRAVVNTQQSAADLLREVMGAPIDKLEDLLFRGQRVTAADQIVAQSLRILNSLATSVQRLQWVQERYRKHQVMVSTLKDIRALSLDEIGRTLPAFDHAYDLAAGVSGGLTGAFGIPGAVTGLPVLLFVALHAIGSHAYHFGHDLSEREEQEFAVLLLIAGLVNRPSQRSPVIERLEDLAYHLERDATHAAAEQNAVAILENVAEAIALRLLLGLLVRSWPGIGLLLGAGYSRALVNHICTLSLAAYQQRWLFRAYGDAARIATQQRV